MAAPAVTYPGKKRFAFTFLGDTDDARVENVRPIYELLYELGMRTTKTVWPLACPEGSRVYFKSQTLEDQAYLDFVRGLVARGFELAWHGATMESSTRPRTLRGLERLDELFDVPIRVCCNHGENRENLYWGAERYRTLPLRLAGRALEWATARPAFCGHVPGSRYFWGDVAREHFTYVRNFCFFTQLNTLAIPPHGPYSLRATPYVRYWFNASDAPDAAAFKRLVTRDAIDRLEAAGGACILATHFGKGFVRAGVVDPQVEKTLRYLASRPGWFVPVSELLDYLGRALGTNEPSPWIRWRLELQHIVDRMLIGTHDHRERAR